MPTTTKRSTRDHLAEEHGYTPDLFADDPMVGAIYAALGEATLDRFHDHLHSEALWANANGHVHALYPDDEDDGPDYEGA